MSEEFFKSAWLRTLPITPNCFSWKIRWENHGILPENLSTLSEHFRTRIKGWRQRLGNLSSISNRVDHFRIHLQSMDKSRVLQVTVHLHPFFHHLWCWRVTYVLKYSTRKKVKLVNSVYWPPVKWQSFPSTQWGRSNTETHPKKKLSQSFCKRCQLRLSN